jgi:hypothetical protein
MTRLLLRFTVFFLVFHLPVNSASGHWVYLNNGKIIEVEQCWENGPKVKCKQQSKHFNVNKSDLKKIVIDIGTENERTVVVDRQGRLVVYQGAEQRDPYVENAFRRLTRKDKSKVKQSSQESLKAYNSWKKQNDQYKGCRQSCSNEYNSCKRTYYRNPSNPRRRSLYQCSDTYTVCTNRCEAFK